MPAPDTTVTTVTFQHELEADCPCGCKVQIGFFDGHMSVIHPMPMCKHFMRYDSPIDYVHFLMVEAMRQAKEHLANASARKRNRE